MDEDVLHAGFGGNLHQSDEVVDVGVHAAVGHKAHEVQAGGSGLAVSFHNHGILGQGTIVDGVGDAAEVLEHHAAGTQIQVTHLGVAHLTIGQTHVLAGGTQHHVRAGGQQFVGERSLGENGSIAGLIGGFRALRVAAPAVADDKYYGFICHGGILSVFRAYVKLNNTKTPGILLPGVGKWGLSGMWNFEFWIFDVLNSAGDARLNS